MRSSITQVEFVTADVSGALAPESKKPDRDLLGKMNRARSLRNGYMHNGDLPDDPKELVDLFENTKTIVKYLRHLDEEQPPGQ